MSARQYLIRFYKQTHSDERATYTCNEFTSRPSAIASFIHSRERLSSPLLFMPSPAKRSWIQWFPIIAGWESRGEGGGEYKTKRNARVSTVIYIGGERATRASSAAENKCSPCTRRSLQCTHWKSRMRSRTYTRVSFEINRLEVVLKVVGNVEWIESSIIDRSHIEKLFIEKTTSASFISSRRSVESCLNKVNIFAFIY